ncbi:MAG: hypothetical protein GQ531_00165 [Sulfurovum sp.]|nr:hypothetical protein [Sulfurovum sp.]
MDKRRSVKRSVVTCAVLVGLTVSPQAQAGWFSDRWDDIVDSITEVQETIVDTVEDVVGGALEDGVVFLLENGAGKGADYIFGLLLKLPGLDGDITFDLMVKIMKNDSIITDDILISMMKNDSMISLIGKLIEEKDTQARATEFFNLSMQRMMPIMMDPNFDISIISEIPTEAYVMFSSLGSVSNNDDALERAWEGMLELAMSDPQTAGTMFALLGQVSPEYQKAMLDFMFLALDAEGVEHIAESYNFNQAMIEGLATMMASDPEATMALFQGLMPMLMTFDEAGNMTGMAPYGERFMTVLGTKMMTCGNESAIALGMAFGQMMPGMIPPSITNMEACGRVESPEAIALINSGNVDYRDSDNDGIPDFMDQYPNADNNEDLDADGIPDAVDNDIDGDGISNEADADDDGVEGTDPDQTDSDNDGINDAHDMVDDTDTDEDGIPDTADNDIDDDGIDNEADADVDGDGIIDNGPDMDNDGINDAHDSDVDGDGIPNEADADDDGVEGTDPGQTDTDNDGINDANDPDIDGDGILNNADVDQNGDGINDNGTDTDNDGINNANDSDIDGDGTPNESDTDIDGDAIDNDADVDPDGTGTNDNGIDTDGDGINDANDSDIDGDGIENGADVDVDGDGTNDNGTDIDGDGINDESDSDVDGDGTTDNGNDSDNDGINDDSDTEVNSGVDPVAATINTLVYTYDASGVLRNEAGTPVTDVNFDKTITTYLAIILPGGNKSVVIQVPLDLLYTDENGNKFIVSVPLDDEGSVFVISMTADGYGRVFMGRDGKGFEMSGDLSGMADGEELVFSVIEVEGQLAGKTTIRPANKNLTFDEN